MGIPAKWQGLGPILSIPQMKAAAPAQAGALAKAWPPLSIEKHLGGDDNQPLVWMLE
jgi:hypothetical protein